MTTATTSQTPAERRRQQQRDDARRAILDSTEAILAEGGYEQFSMRRLADRCGYTAPTIYHYFGDKAGLLDSVIEACFSRLLTRLQQVRNGDSPLELLRVQSESFVRFSLQNPTHYRLLTAPRPEGRVRPQSVESAISALNEPLIALEEMGRLHNCTAEEAGQQLWVLLHGIISLRISRPDLEWTESLVTPVIETLLRGLVAPEKAPSAPGRNGS
jgi:AcrR family transcriptional regulator